MEPIDKGERIRSIPKGSRKELLRSNIKSVMEKTTLEMHDEKSLIDQDLNQVTSVGSVDPDMEHLDKERMDEIRRAKRELKIVEREMEEEFKRLLSEIEK